MIYACFIFILVELRNDWGKTEKRKFLKRTSRVSSGKPPQALVETHSSNFTSKEDALILKPFVYFLIFTAKKYHNLPTFLQAKEVVVTSRTQPVRLSVPARRISTSSWRHRRLPSDVQVARTFPSRWRECQAWSARLARVPTVMSQRRLPADLNNLN